MRHLLDTTNQIVFVFLCLVGWSSLAQDMEQLIDSTVVDKYDSYFVHNRKTIHLHLNKSTYAVGEHIWFSAYIFDQKKNKISLEDTYIYISLLNRDGKEIDQKTVWYSFGVGNGELFLDNNLESGDYYLRVYTAKMNLFREDDSSVYPVRIINFESQLLPVASSRTDRLDIEVGAESGRLLDGVFGSCVMRIRDASGNPIIPDSTFLISEGKKAAQPIGVNPMGIGRISLIAESGSNNSIRIYLADSIYEVETPPVQLNGFTIATDHHYSKRELLVSIYSNRATLRKSKENLALLVHKDGNQNLYPVKLGSKDFSDKLIVPYDDLFPGVNTLSLLNQHGELKAERLVFKPPANSIKSKLINISDQNDSINLYVKSLLEERYSKVSKASISVLPSNTISSDQKISMSSRFFLKQYLSFSDVILLAQRDYNNDHSALYDLDALLLLKGKGRYRWGDILSGRYQQTEDVVSTMLLRGYVNTFETKNDSLKVMLYSNENGILETVPLDSDKNFIFKEIRPLAKNSKISFTLLDKLGKPVYANFFFTIHPNVVRYRHSLNQADSSLKITEYKSQKYDSELFKDAEQLDEVVVTADKLTRKKLFGRMYGKFYGRKITDADRGQVSLENLIRSYGYRVGFMDTFFYDLKRAGTWQIYRTCQGMGGPVFLFPAISIDGVYSRDITEFSHIRLDYIDEVYYLKESICDPGLFVVFTNSKYRNRQLPESKKNTKEFTVNIGHNVPIPFVRPAYDSLDSPAYDRYGIVSWIPNLLSNEKGVYSIKVPNDQKDKLNLELEGFHMDGTIFSNSLEVELNK